MQIQILIAVDTIGAILDRKRTSVTALLKDTQAGFNSIFEADQQAPEDIIFELFRFKDREEACIGKLLSVSTEIFVLFFQLKKQ